MKTAAKKKKNKSILLCVLLIVLAVYGIVTLTTLQISLGKQKRELAQLEKQREELSYTVQELQNMVDEGRNSDLLERTLRTKFNYVYEQEDVIIVTGN